MATGLDSESVSRGCNAATRVFKDSFVDLIEGIQDPDKLAAELYANDVILRTTRDQVTQITLTREQKNTQLLAAVESQLHVNPKSFEVFLCALRERIPLNDLCMRMDKAYCQPSAQSTSESDSCGQNQVLSPASASELTPFSETVTTSLIPNRASRVFPYLNMGEMNEQQKLTLQGKLLEDSDNIMAEFSDVVHFTITSLNANPEVTVETLSSRVASLGAYKPIRAQKPLLRDKLKEIRACTTIDGIFFILQEYYSFFNYGIIQRIITWFGMPDDEQRLEDYTKHFKEFCKRRVFECPPDIFGHTSDDKSTLVVKTEDSWDPCDETQSMVLDQVLRLRNTLAKVLEVECETLYLCRIDKGCMELKFQVPSFVQTDIFPVSMEQRRSLIKLGVASLSCGIYTFSRQVAEDSNKNDSSDSEVDRQQENESDIENERRLMSQLSISSSNRQEWLPTVSKACIPSEIPSIKTIIEDDRPFQGRIQLPKGLMHPWSRNAMDNSDLALEEALQNVGGEEDSSDDELLPALCEARTPSEIPSLKTIIEDERLFLMFRRFLKDQCITRNLNFWLACEHFRKLPSHDNQEHLHEVGKAIYAKFIKQSAAQHVTILDHTKRSIKMSLELRIQVTPQLFATAQQEIYEVMEKNEFRQFLVSDFFPDCSVSQVPAAVFSPSMANPAEPSSENGQLKVPSIKHTQSNLSQKAMAHINNLAQREVQDALKDLEIMKQVNKKSWSHKPTGSAYSSSILSTTSDSGVGDSLATSDLDTPPSNVQAYRRQQDILTRSMPERDRQAQVAASVLISNSPQPDQLDWVTQSMPQLVSQERHRSRQAHQFVNYPQAYSDDESILDSFIPKSRRLPPQFHSDFDDPHHFSHSRHYNPPRRLTDLKRSHFMHTHKPSPPSIAERGMTPQRQSEDILVVYHLDDFPTPYAKRIGGVEITLAEFKEKVFARKGNYRYFFKSFCEDTGMWIMEEYLDDAAVLPHRQGKIIGCVETVT